MIVYKSISDNTATLKLSGSFIFNDRKEFTESYMDLLEAGRISSILVELSDIRYMDSAALGMLLLLREFAASKNIGVTLAHPTESVQKIIEIANFSKLFQII